MDWNEWIKFFLATVTKQCEKYIQIIMDINELYSRHMSIACNMARSSNMVDIINALYIKIQELYLQPIKMISLLSVVVPFTISFSLIFPGIKDAKGLSGIK